MPTPLLLILADAVLVIHFAVVLFVVGGLILVLLGQWRGWSWVHTPWFRYTHLAAIAVVVGESWLGLTCPLTTLESWLRVQAGGSTNQQSFIAYWLQRWLFYSAPGWVFTLVYTVFGAAVVGVWWRYPPHRGPQGTAGTGPPDRSGRETPD